MRKLKIGVLPGDGIGQDVTFAAIPILEALDVPIELIFGDIGWECWKKEGNPIPSKTWKLINKVDAILLGATTSMPEKEAFSALPKHLASSRLSYVSPIVQLRQNLDLYANIRPCFNIKNDANDFNFCIIRENTEGLYAGFDFYPLPKNLHDMIISNDRWKHVSTDTASCSLRLQSIEGLTRLFEFAFTYANNEKYSRVTFADKPNVLRKSGAFARDIFEMVSAKYKHIKSDIHNIDAVALWMVKRPQEFGVIVAENMFGDILSDVGAGIMGGLGLASSANIGKKGCYFEPVHGSAPRIKTNTANPGAMFLTIGLLLKHFGYYSEADRIKKSIMNVIKDGEYLTYDLGGNSSTQTMAQAIIDQVLEPQTKKFVSFIATGSELINGEVEEKNNYSFSKLIHEKGGYIFQHLKVSDKKNDICSSLSYLLSKSDAVIITGGLGPTSDDTTRFAIADVIKQELHFNEAIWQLIVERLNRFNLVATEANRQQALFPKNSDIYVNENGTASGCHIAWNNKHIFMLPGPPKECIPLFNNYVINDLNKLDFFQTNNRYIWMTLGLLEGEITKKIEEITKHELSSVAYHWDYPYLAIKLITNKTKNDILANSIESLLLPYIVSKNGKKSFEILEELVQTLSNKITIIDEVTFGHLMKSISLVNLKYNETKPKKITDKFALHIFYSDTMEHCENFNGSISLECHGYHDNIKKYSHTISFPNRGKETLEYLRNYVAWQISQYIKFCKEKLWI